MKNCYYSFVLLFLLLIPSMGIAGTIKGKITDGKGTILSFATVYVQGTTIGTSAGSGGEYQLTLQPGTYRIICQFIGYKQSSFNVTITGNETVEHNFKLADQSLEMKEVVVRASDEDPAYPIIRNTIGRRKFHLKQVKSFQTSIYLKGAMRTRKVPTKVMGQKVDKNDLGVDSMGKGVVYLCEEFADYYAEEPNKERTVIHSVRESGNPNGVGFSEIPSVSTFYENNISLFENVNPRGFISPISDNAIFYYKYRLQGEFTEEGYTIYKIKVIPRRLYEPLFNGTIYIVKDDWAIHSIKMELTKTSNLAFMDTLRLEQVFLPLKKDNWVIKNQVMFVAVNIFGFDATGGFVTVYDKQKVNEPIPDTMFKNKVVSVYDHSANKKDTSLWSVTRPVPLEVDEVKDYKIKDSMRIVTESPKYKDSVRRKNNKLTFGDVVLSGMHYGAKGNKTFFNTNALLTMVNYNTVEGWNVAPKVTWLHRIDTGKFIRGAVAVRYGFNDQHLNAMGRIAYVQNNRQWVGRGWSTGIEGGKYILQYNAENPVLPLFNSISTLFWGENDLKLYERWSANAYYSKNFGNGLRWKVKLGYEQRLPMENTTKYTVLKDIDQHFTSNTPPNLLLVAPWEKNEAVLFNGTISYQPGYTYVQYPDYKMSKESDWPVFTLKYDKGIPNILNSKTDYDKWRFSIKDNVRLKLLGSISYNVALGGFLNSKYVSFPDLMHLYGNRGIGFASPYLSSFQFAQYYVFDNTEKLYGEVHVEYYMRGLLTNKIPLLRQARWYFLLGNNSFYANANKYYAEAFIGIDNLGYKKARFLRVDFVQSWDSYRGTNSGIRFGINIIGAKISLGDPNEEW
ncbi:MAG: DUF5686 and carboxypeptidase regulatory-like domain-containing protein [Bacteroidota bacterium]